MANYKQLIPFIQKWEGGWADDPDDRGGATMMGVTIGTYTEYCKRKGRPVPSPDDLRAITLSDWEDIFKTLYWDRWKADQIRSQSVANILVDWVWGSGVHGIKIPQRIVTVAQDGAVGNVTLGAINRCDPTQLFDLIQTARIEFVENIVRRDPSQGKFLKGWKNRILDLKFIG